MTPEESRKLEEALNGMQGAAATFAAQLLQDEGARRAYNELARENAAAIRAAVAGGQMTPEQGARAAHQLRGELLEMIRGRSSPVGREAAKAMKKTNKPFEELLTKYAMEKFKKPWDALGPAERSTVFSEIVEASGRPNAKVNLKVARMGKLARGLWIISIGVAVYEIATAEDKIRATFKEAGSLAGGIVGGALTGAAVGAMGGGPIGVVIGGLVGGILGGIFGDQLGEAMYEHAQKHGTGVKTCRIGTSCYVGFGEVMGRDGIIRPAFGPKW